MSELNDSNNNNNRAIYISNSNSANLEEIEQNDIHNEPSAIIISSPDISPSRITSGVTINFANFTGFLAPQASDIFGSGSSVSWTANSSSNEAGYRSSSSALMSTTNSSRDGSDSETRGADSERTSLDNTSSPFGIENFVRNSQADFIEDLTKPSFKRNEDNAELESNNNNTNKILKGEKEENDVCSICLEKWADSGPHQISSTKCGHLFGKSCILRWISSSNSDYSKCPTCNQKASRNDIRPLFVGNLAVKDQKELDNLQRVIREKDHTICRVNNELIGYRHSNLKANAQIGFLEGQLNSLRKRKFNGDLGNIVNPNFESNANSIQIYPMDLRYKLSNSTSLPTRSLAYIEEHDILLVGKQMDLESQGVMTISQLSNPKKAQKTISLGHQSQIKNIKTFITPSGRIFSLSGGMDCNLIYRKHSIQGKEKFVKTEILHSFKLQNKVFSCCFNTEDPNIFYAAGIGGTLYYFNLMVKTDGPAKIFQPQILKGPTIIFLDFLPQTGHLMVVTLKDVFIAKLNLDEEEIFCIKRYASGNMGIFSVSHIANQTYLFSLRHLDESYVEHRIAKFEFVFTQSVHTNRYRGENNENQGSSNTDLGYEFNTLNTYTNAGKQLNMTQTAAFQNPIDFNHILIASPGHNDNSVIVRSVREDESTTDDIQLPNSETVNYLKFIRIGKKFNNEDEDGDDEEFYVDEGPASAPAVQSATTDSNEIRLIDVNEGAGSEGENKEFEKPQPLMTSKEEKALINIRLLVLTNQSVYLYKICYSGELSESY